MNPDHWQCQKQETGRDQQIPDAPPHPLPDDVSRMIALHISRGEWRRAFAVLESARQLAIDAAHEQQARSFESIGLDERTIGRLCDAGLSTIQELQEMSDDELLELEGIGLSTVALVRVALQNAGL